MPLAYLDNAASSQQPDAVIDAVADYARAHHANVHRGVHTLSQEATALYEGARERVRRFVNAAVARGDRVRARHDRGDQPGRAVAMGARGLPPATRSSSPGSSTTRTSCPGSCSRRRPARVSASCRSTSRGVVDFDAYLGLLGPRTRIVALAHVSNALGTVLPIAEFLAAARERGIVTVVDGAQAVPHLPVDVQALGCDFYAFSAHKMYGPTGIGVLYAREALLAAMPPWQGGGDMILTVSFEGSTWNHLPHRFEAGTPNIGGAVGLGAAIDYLDPHRPRAHRRPRAGPARLRDAKARRDPRAHAGRHGARQEQPRLVHGRGRAPARSRHGARLARRRGAHRVITARCRSWNTSACRRRRAPRSASTTRAPKSTRCSDALQDAIRMLR